MTMNCNKGFRKEQWRHPFAMREIFLVASTVAVFSSIPFNPYVFLIDFFFADNSDGDHRFSPSIHLRDILHGKDLH